MISSQKDKLPSWQLGFGKKCVILTPQVSDDLKKSLLQPDQPEFHPNQHQVPFSASFLSGINILAQYSTMVSKPFAFQKLATEFLPPGVCFYFIGKEL